MGTYVLKNIEMTLDASSIQKAIDEIEKLERDLQNAMHYLIEDLTKQGVEFAKMEIAQFPRPAIDTGDLQTSISDKMTEEREGVVYTDVDYAVYVEYGTGIIGREIPHPNPAKWEYDSKGHGADGWVYKSDRDGKFHWTLGYESRPFMFYTLRDLEEFARQNGGRIIAEYIP